MVFFKEKVKGCESFTVSIQKVLLRTYVRYFSTKRWAFPDKNKQSEKSKVQ